MCNNMIRLEVYMKKLDVREATLRYDVTFVSSIRTYGNLGPFRPRQKKDFKGIRLFDLILRPDQVVCGSTVHAGDADGSIYGNWGVIIGSGEIQQAFPYDAASYIDNGHAVSPYGWRNEGVDVEEQLQRAIESRNRHNEVDIALGQHSIAGIFIGTMEIGADGIDMPSDDVLEMISPLPLPMYQLSHGEFFNLHDGVASETPTPPSRLIEYYTLVPSELAAHMKQELTRRLLLPPRNAVSAGWQAGKVQARRPDNEFRRSVERHLLSKDLDRRYFASMAIFAAGVEELYANAIFDEQTYHELANRIDEEGFLQADMHDIDYYLKTGRVPDYLGSI